jgi:hypothetical protein
MEVSIQERIESFIGDNKPDQVIDCPDGQMPAATKGMLKIIGQAMLNQQGFYTCKIGDVRTLFRAA